MTDHAGPLLVRAGLITEEKLRAALQAIAAPSGRTLVEELVTTGAVTEERLCRFFHDRLLVPIVGPSELAHVSRRALRLLGGDLAAELRCVPLHVDGHRNLSLAMSDPSDTHAVDQVQFATGMTVFRVAAAPTAIAGAVLDLYGVATPLATRPPAPRRPLPPAEIVEDVYAEDTPIPQPIPFDQTSGRVVLIDPRALAATLAQLDRRRDADPVAEAALREAVQKLETASERDAVAAAVVAFMGKVCRRGAFFIVRRGELVGHVGHGIGIRADALRDAALPLDRPSTFRDAVEARLPFRGPVVDAASRDFLIDGLGWAPGDMLAIPLAVRDRVVAVIYGDERLQPVPDEFLQTLARAAELALERALVARRQP